MGLGTPPLIFTVNLSKQYGFETVANFMIGYLGESKETFRQTVNFAKKNDPDYVNFSITVVKPNSGLSQDLKDGDNIIRLWKDYVLGESPKIDYKYVL